MKFFRYKKIAQMISTSLAVGAGNVAADYYGKPAVNIEPISLEDQKSKVISTVIQRAFKDSGYTSFVDVKIDKTCPMGVIHPTSKNPARVIIDPDEFDNNLRAIYAVAGHESRHIMNNDTYKYIALRDSLITLSLLSWSIHPVFTPCGLLLQKLLLVQLSRMCEKNADLESVDKLKTHDELSGFLTASDRSNDALYEEKKTTLIESGKTPTIVEPPKWLCDLVMTHPLDWERVAYIKEAKKDNQSNSFFETEEFKELERQYANAMLDCSQNSARP